MTQAAATRKRPSTEDLAAPAARFFELQREAIDTEARTVRLAFSSEQAKVERWYGLEVLKHDADAVRLGRLAAGGALLVDHRTGDQIGVVESVSLDQDRVGRALVRFGKSARASEIFQDVQDGIRRHVSVGYIVHAWDVQEGRGDAPTTYTATDWEPLEISIVSIPADPSVGIGRGLTDEQASHLARSFGLDPAPGPAAPASTTTTTAKPQEEIRIMDKTPEQLAAERAAEATAARTAGAEAQANATKAIIALGRTFAHHGAERLAADYLQSGKSDPAEFQAQLLQKIGTAGNDTSRGEIGMDEREVKQFSFLRAMRFLASPNDSEAAQAAAFERECSTEARKKNGMQRGVGLTIPVDVLRGAQAQRDLTVGTATAGGHSVATNLLAGSFIELLRNKMAIQRLGATTLNGLSGNIAIPRMTSGGTAYWVAESGAPTESQQAIDQVTMSPKTVGAYTDISRRLMLQSSIDVEMMVRNDLAKVLGLEIDRVALYGTGSSNQPTGIKLVSGVNTVDLAAAAATFAEIVSMETLVAADNADIGTLAYLVNATGRGGLKTTEKASSTGQFVWEQGNTVNGYRTEVSNQVASGDYWFGNWSDVMLGFWSGLDLVVDPYSNSTSGTVRVVVLQDVDVAARHGESFTRANNTL